MITAAVQTMARRYDASVADPPLTARVRLVSGDEAHDVVLDGDGAEVVEADGRRPDAVISGFMRHVERTFPAARHVELDCGHVPQVERPRETHAAMREFLAG